MAGLSGRKSDTVTSEMHNYLEEILNYVNSKSKASLHINHDERNVNQWQVKITIGDLVDFVMDKVYLINALDEAVHWTRGRRVIEKSNDVIEEDEDDEEPQLAAKTIPIRESKSSAEISAMLQSDPRKYAERINSLGEPKQIMNTMPQWLYHRFGPAGVVDWDNLTPADQSFWRHEAEAVKRAVERGGFKIDW